MSDRRPELFTLDLNVSMIGDHRDDDEPWVLVDGEAYPATVEDVIAFVRRGVESGTIKGEVIWRCGEGSGHEDGWFCDRAVPTDQLGPNCGYRLLIPVSDGGSET